MRAIQIKMCDLNLENDKNAQEYNEKIRIKDMQIEKLNEELTHIRSITKSQETTVSYFRKKIEEINK